MNPLHLLWIIPASLAAGGAIGFFTALLLQVADASEDDI